MKKHIVDMLESRPGQIGLFGLYGAIPLLGVPWLARNADHGSVLVVGSVVGGVIFLVGFVRPIVRYVIGRGHDHRSDG